MSAADQRKPIVVLVRPQLGENIGKAARAMLNFGLTEMRLVEPRDGWPNPSAGPPRPEPTSSSTGRRSIPVRPKPWPIARMSTPPPCASAASPSRSSHPRKRAARSPVRWAAARSCSARNVRVSKPEDVALARAILTVPINPEFGSLDLAQAVILCAYEWSKHEHLVQPTREELLPPAPQEDLDGLIGHLEGMLEPKGYFLPEGRAPRQPAGRFAAC